MVELDVVRTEAGRATERAARRELRRQITALETKLSAALATAFPHGAPGRTASASPALPPGPRVLGLGELEEVRDALAERLAHANRELEALGRRQARARLRLERMLLEPGRHRFQRVANAELGEGGCGVWQVRPRLGLIGMLMGWWQVKLSSGCPLAA